jgi:hypothetical protein
LGTCQGYFRDQLWFIYVKKKKEPNPKVENDAINAIER